MTTIEVLYFLNEIDFSDKLDNNQLEKTKQSKKTIVPEFEDVKSNKKIHSLNLIDDIDMSFVTNNDGIDYRAERTQSLRSNIFYLLSFKQLADTKNKKMKYNISAPPEK